MGCGYCKLRKKGRLAGLKLPEFSGDEGRDTVKGAEGAHEVLSGKHFEAQVVINLVNGKTLEPRPNDQHFIVDGWAIGELGLAASTVEQPSVDCRNERVSFNYPLFEDQYAAAHLGRRRWAVASAPAEVTRCATKTGRPARRTG